MYYDYREEIKQLCKRLKEIIDMREWLVYLGLQDKGGGRFLCPFHPETRPSFTATKHIAMDWHENRPYDLFESAKHIKGWSFLETLKEAANFAGINIEEWINFVKENKQTPVTKILNEGKFYFDKYKDEVLEKFYSQKGYEIPEMLFPELYYFPENSSHPQRGRLCVVWCDSYGNPQGFVGRALSENVLPKYKYTAIEIGGKFSKSCFYNIHKAKFAQKILIVEGIWDALVATLQSNEVVATGGVVSPKINFFSDFGQNGFYYKKNTKVGTFPFLKAVVFAPDPDGVGVKAFLNSIDTIYPEIFVRGAECFGVLLEKDLDETIMKDKVKLETLFNQAKPVKEFIEDIKNKYAKSKTVKSTVIKKIAEEKIQITDPIIRMIADRSVAEIEILKEISKIEYETEKEKYIKKLSEIRKISKSAILKDLRNIEKQAKENDFLENLTFSNKIKIAHPTYYVDEFSTVLGFVFETIDKNNNLIQVPMKIINNLNKNIYIKTEKICQLEGYTYIYEDKNRNLPSVTEFWNKKDIEEIYKKEFKTVPLSKIYVTIQKLIDTFVELPSPEYTKILALYCILTYFYGCFPSIPFLFIFGPKGSGKSHLLSIMKALCMNAVKCKGITVAALGDTVDSYKGTLIIDQAETLSLPHNLEIVGILADSYSVTGGKRRIVNIENNVRKVIELDTFCPKIFASVKEIDDDLRDRTILIQMIKSTKKFNKPNFSAEIWGKIRGELYKNFLKHGSLIYTGYKSFHRSSERAEEILQPLEYLMIYMNLQEEEINSVLITLKKSIQLTQFEMTEDEKLLFEGILECFGLYDDEVKITDKKIRDILVNKNINKAVRWAVSKMKQYSLIKEVIKEKEGSKGITYYVVEKEKAETVYDRYFFNISSLEEKVNAIQDPF